MDKDARDNVFATKFAFPAICQTSVVNTEIAESWRCCRADHASETFEKVAYDLSKLQSDALPRSSGNDGWPNASPAIRD